MHSHMTLISVPEICKFCMFGCLSHWLNQNFYGDNAHFPSSSEIAEVKQCWAWPVLGRVTTKSRGKLDDPLSHSFLRWRHLHFCQCMRNPPFQLRSGNPGSLKYVPKHSLVSFSFFFFWNIDWIKWNEISYIRYTIIPSPHPIFFFFFFET